MGIVIVLDRLRPYSIQLSPVSDLAILWYIFFKIHIGKDDMSWCMKDPRSVNLGHWIYVCVSAIYNWFMWKTWGLWIPDTYYVSVCEVTWLECIRWFSEWMMRLILVYLYICCCFCGCCWRPGHVSHRHKFYVICEMLKI